MEREARGWGEEGGGEQGGVEEEEGWEERQTGDTPRIICN